VQLKIGDMSATGDPIHFMFGSRVGFSVSADRMALMTMRLVYSEDHIVKRFSRKISRSIFCVQNNGFSESHRDV